MNKDKMELEESIRELESLSPSETAIKTVLQALKEQGKEIVKYQIYLTENSIPKKKIEDILKKLDSKKVEERVIKFYTPDKKHYYETDKYNDIIRQVLQGLLEDK